jgi:hypothetical protein
MAALDRRLRRGETVLRGIERVREGCENFARAFRGGKHKDPEAAPSQAEQSAPPPPPEQI